MTNEATSILIFSAFAVGLVHTLLGPDHYVPFIALARARQWSLTKASVITALCGIGHILSAVIIGFGGVFIGLTATKLNFIETYRGEIAAWFLIIFGLVYLIRSARSTCRNRKHTHLHVHKDGEIHRHLHDHHSEHAHIHVKKNKELTPWILFIIFIFGPCEPLIPLIMYPAIKGSMINVLFIILLFGVATLLTMLSVVVASIYGTKLLRFAFLEKHGNAIAGGVICCSGLAIKFLGL